IELVGLNYEKMWDRSPFELSGGQKRRVAIAGVIAMKPQILILDEPTAGLDPKAHEDVLNMVKKIHKDENNAILLISHNMGDIAKLCDKVLVMDQGKLILEGTPEEVFSQEEFLVSLGLAVPPAAAFINQLKRKGLPVKGNPLTLSQVEEELVRLLGEHK
ncbi:MAG: ATP-binding cassette domain-containing protein, partial [Anaerovorax sp.]